MKRHFYLLIASSLALSTLSCTEPEEKPEPIPSTKVIKILSPVTAGATFQIAGDVTIIAESDYSKFASGLNYQYSADNGKTWELMMSKPRKEGMDKDTLVFNFGTELPGVIAPGTKVGFQVIDYNKAYSDKTPFFTFN